MIYFRDLILYSCGSWLDYRSGSVAFVHAAVAQSLQVQQFRKGDKREIGK